MSELRTNVDVGSNDVRTFHYEALKYFVNGIHHFFQTDYSTHLNKGSTDFMFTQCVPHLNNGPSTPRPSKAPRSTFNHLKVRTYIALIPMKIITKYPHKAVSWSELRRIPNCTPFCRKMQYYPRVVRYTFPIY